MTHDMNNNNSMTIATSEHSVEVPNLRKEFFFALCTQGTVVTIFLVSGIKLQGQIKYFSEDSLILERGDVVQLLLMHTISSIMPSDPFSSPYAEKKSSFTDSRASFDPRSHFAR
jgi:host factor-I protein